MSQRRPFPWTASMHDYWEKSPCLSDQQDRSQVVGSPLLTAQQDPHICRDPEQQPSISEMPQNTPELSLSTMSRTTGPAALLICQFKKNPKPQKTRKLTKKLETAWSQHLPHSPGLVSHSHIRSQAAAMGFLHKPLYLPRKSTVMTPEAPLGTNAISRDKACLWQGKEIGCCVSKQSSPVSTFLHPPASPPGPGGQHWSPGINH